MIVFAPIIHKEQVANCGPDGHFCYPQMHGSGGDTVIGVELRGGGMGLNKHEKPGRTRLPGGVGRIGDAQ